MPITVPCLKCKKKFQVPSKLAGTTVRCEACGALMRLPSRERIQAKIKSPAAAGKTASVLSRAPSASSTDEIDMVDLFEDPVAPAAKGTPSMPATSAQEPPVLSCSHCEGLLYYDSTFANQTVACPHCGNHLIMPAL